MNMRLLLATIVLASFANPAAQADDIEGPRCVEVSKSTPYRGYGYLHIVHVNNTCEERVVCQVSTDVTPEPQTVQLAPQAREDVVTRVGSPASTFVARVDCETE